MNEMRERLKTKERVVKFRRRRKWKTGIRQGRV